MRKCFLFIAVVYLNNTVAQNVVSDSALRQSAYNNAVHQYFTSIGERALIYEGAEVLAYQLPSDMHPFFIASEFSVGSVNANGVQYKDVNLLYDLVNDKLIVRHYNTVLKVEQVSEKVDEFQIQSHNFVKLIPDSVSQAVITNGFYDELYKGRAVSLYARRQKVPEEQIKDMQVVLRFNERNRYFIKKDGQYIPVSDRKSVMRVMSDRKKEMDDFLRRNKIKFKRQPEEAMVRMTAYYDSLNR